MSFDEQPDDPHGECRAEIERLKGENARLKLKLNTLADAYLGYVDDASDLGKAIAAAREEEEA